MSERESQSDRQEDGKDIPQKGPSLWLMYSLAALALAAAIGFALMIVLPFYLRR